MTLHVCVCDLFVPVENFLYWNLLYIGIYFILEFKMALRITVFLVGEQVYLPLSFVVPPNIVAT